MNFILTAFLFFLLVVHSKAQTTGQKTEPAKTQISKIGRTDSSLQFWTGKNPLPDKNALYVEWFGSSANVYSLNYERCIFLHKLRYDNWARVSVSAGANWFLDKYAVPL